MTLGIFNRNPLNIKNNPRDPWWGTEGLDEFFARLGVPAGDRTPMEIFADLYQIDAHFRDAAGASFLRSDRQGHAIFVDRSCSYRAGARTLQVYSRRGQRTLEQIIGGIDDDRPGWAMTADGNNPANYAAFVSRRIPHTAHGDLHLFDEDGRIVERNLIVDLFEVMAELEQLAGFREIPENIYTGIALFEKHFIK